MKQTDLTAYNKYIRKKWIVLLVMIGLLFASAIASLSAGSANLSVIDIVRTIFGGGNRQQNTIIWNVRMPRVATATVVGMALALSGCVMQNVLRNPLASASTLGVSQGASFGAAVAIVYFGAGIQVNAGGTASALTVTNPAMVTLCAFFGGIATTAVILGLARFRGSSPATMVLAGVAISSMFTGGTALVQYFCDDVMVATVVYWTFGSLGRAGWTEIAIIAALTFAAFVFFYYNRWNYNAMEGGTHTAKSLGVPVDRLIVLSMALCALISSVAVAFVGCISFIGLIASHIMRRFVGDDYRFLIPCSALCGGVLLLLSDIVSRMLLSPTVLPIGALTSFLGAPLFLYLIIKGGKRK
ncbi:MAG: iron ABC transporter permease [Ruminococcaceae bacterium]|nr:iron ABC transporter permease [Oscillospiraceae bacterium]